MIRVARVCATFLVASLLATSGCGTDAPPATPRRDVAPVWSDVFERTPDIYIVVRPRAIKRDGVYGALWASVMRLAQARGFTRGASMVEAVEGAEEIVVGLGKGPDAALVLRGVPASLDPQRVNDAGGQPLFRAIDERRRVVEYELLDPSSAGAGALFVLPDRTWVGALGDARKRARMAFAQPRSTPRASATAPTVDDRALAAVRCSGPVVHLLDRHPLLAPLSRELVTATITLRPAKGGLEVGLTYGSDAEAARAELEAKRIAAELAKDEKQFGWLKDATAARDGKVVLVRVAVPPRLLEELPKATGADILPPGG